MAALLLQDTKMSGSTQAWKDANKDKILEASRRWRAANPEFDRCSRVASSYGLETKDVMALVEKQQGSCAICGNAETVKGKDGKIKSLSLDHCHATGIVRGLLCDHCNHMLGHAKDNVATLQAAAVYLKVANTGLKVHGENDLLSATVVDALISDLMKV
jgi:hypothetical protein